MLSSFSTSLPGLPLAPAVYLLSVSLPLLIFSESRSFYAGSVIFKIASSLAFITRPLLHEPSQWPPYRLLITSGLLLSLVGDILLIPSRNQYLHVNPSADTNPTKPEDEATSTAFKLGMLAFAAAHGAYILAFFQGAEDVCWGSFACTFAATMGSAGVLGVLGASGWGNVLDLCVPEEMRILVSGYAVVISCMLAASVATCSEGVTRLACWGALMFVVSDVFVARDVFGRKSAVDYSGVVERGRYGWRGRAVGWVLYFWGQMVLAGTVGG